MWDYRKERVAESQTQMFKEEQRCSEELIAVMTGRPSLDNIDFFRAILHSEEPPTPTTDPTERDGVSVLHVPLGEPPVPDEPIPPPNRRSSEGIDPRNQSQRHLGHLRSSDSLPAPSEHHPALGGAKRVLLLRVGEDGRGLELRPQEGAVLQPPEGANAHGNILRREKLLVRSPFSSPACPSLRQAAGRGKASSGAM